MAPSVTTHTVYNWAGEIVFSSTEQAAILLEQLFHFVRLFRFGSSVMGDAILFELVVEILIKLPQLLDSVGDAIPQVLIGLWLLMTLAINLEERFVVGANYIDAQATPLCALRVIGSSAALIITGDSDANHVSAY
jgi:hypothetical protein